MGIAGIWGIFLVIYLVNSYYIENQRNRFYKIVLLLLTPIVSFFAPVLVRDASIISWNIYELSSVSEHVFVNLIIIIVIGVLLGLLFLPIVIMYSHLFYYKTKKEDRFLSILTLVAITYFLVGCTYYSINM